MSVEVNGVDAFCCPVSTSSCNKVFSTKKLLRQHLAQVHRYRGEITKEDEDEFCSKYKWFYFDKEDIFKQYMLPSKKYPAPLQQQQQDIQQPGHLQQQQQQQTILQQQPFLPQQIHQPSLLQQNLFLQQLVQQKKQLNTITATA